MEPLNPSSPSPTPQCDVLIVGAGPTGLMAACELARRGIAVRVLDSAPGPFTGSRGKGLQPRSLEVLDNLGVAGELVSRGRFRLPVRFYAPDGSSTDADLSAGSEPDPASPYARTLLIPQWRVEETLRRHLEGLGAAPEWDRTVTGIVQHPGHAVAGLADGSTVTARYVIGADGGSSTVRRLLGMSFLGTTDEDERMLLGDVRLDGLDRDHWHIFQGSDGTSVALCPLPAQDSFQIQAPVVPGDTSDPTVETFQGIVDALVGPGRVRLHEATWLSRWRLNVRMVDRYREDRVLLAGDAAHVHSPAGGQGMNTGIQDAANLGWKLAAVLHGAPDALLDTYQAERLPVAAAVLGLSSRLMDQDAGAHGAEMDQLLQLGHTYRGGPLAPAADPAAGGPQPGDRAPDAPCHLPDGSPATLFGLRRGGHWTLYGFGCAPRAHPAVRTVEIGADITDTHHHARQAYGADNGDMVLVRPDGHIAVRSRDADAVAAYLDEHLGGAPVPVHA
ncbi:FAD-dependent monooxygenase [Streptomyces sp. NBC_00859]|uniref:FAD-dependent monooxygenase n=1 Tax=Streptomyces sp. NBC_00859 TaxID=2903682 RepID=UPI00386A18A3|nr:FAD-dependent monooxygenase [Streptomyces sp. NBC_00859]